VNDLDTALIMSSALKWLSLNQAPRTLGGSINWVLAPFLNFIQVRQITIVRCARQSWSNVTKIFPGFSPCSIVRFSTGSEHASLKYATTDDQFDGVITGVEQFDRKATTKAGLDHCIHMNT
jgi:hypothetical protein